MNSLDIIPLLYKVLSMYFIAALSYDSVKMPSRCDRSIRTQPTNRCAGNRCLSAVAARETAF